MKKEKISFKCTHGNIDGIYINAGNTSPLVIIINGHNGFYNYGFFPYLQQQLFKNNTSSYSFNYSHGGIISDSDFFEDIKSYEKNCMRLEVEDVMCVLHNLTSESFKNHKKVFLLAHSLGGVPTIFSAKKAQDENIKIAGIILISTVKQLNFWPKEKIEEWTKNKVFYQKNNRTNQLLPLGEEFLNEVLESDTKWNVKNEIQQLRQPVLILHGENDESVPMENGTTLFKWILSSNKKSSLKLIQEASHTFNTKHPFSGTTAQLEEMIEVVTGFIYSL